jgi:hypothetical protein
MRIKICWKTGLRWLVLLLICSSLSVVFWPAQAQAATGVIADDAEVLNTAVIKPYTDAFSYTVNIFTTRVFRGSDADFDSSVHGLTSNDTNVPYPCDPTQQIGCELFSPQTIPEYDGILTPVASTTTIMQRNDDANQSVEVGIDVPARHLAIFAGSQVTIPQDRYENAIQAFADTMHQSHDNYTQATVAALNALQSASDRFWNGVRAAGPWIFLGVVCLAGIIFTLVARAMGWNGGNSSGYRWRDYDNRGGGGGFGGGGGVGGGASGNF